VGKEKGLMVVLKCDNFVVEEVWEVLSFKAKQVWIVS